MKTKPTSAQHIIQRSLGLLACVASLSATACPVEALTGTICATAATYCPSGDGNGYMLATGQSLNINQYQLLFAVIGYTYGGVQNVSFNLPDLRGRTPVGLGQGPGLSNVNRGQTRGAEAAAMYISNMANHSHSAVLSPVGMSANIPVSTTPTSVIPQTTPDATHNYLSASPPSVPASAAIWTDTTSTKIASVGGIETSVSGVNGNIAFTATGQQSPAPVPTLPPQLGLNFCIATEGVFPVNPN